MKRNTGTVYALTDPRNGETRYIGATTQPLKVRLNGHLSSKSRRVRAWVDELKAAGLRPGIVPVREDVPAGELKAAEDAEITRIVAAGGSLLNEASTAKGRQLNTERQWAERDAAEQAAWAELATAAIGLFGGPLPPGDLPEVTIPDVSWNFMSKVRPGHREYMDSLLGSGPVRDGDIERHRLWSSLSRAQDEAERGLWNRTGGTWSLARQMGGRDFTERMERYFATVAKTPCATRAEASRHLALIAWYMVAACPWRHLAEISGNASDDAAFIAWAGWDTAVREALEFLAARHPLEHLGAYWERDRFNHPGPGRLLGTIAAAYTDTEPASAIRSDVTGILGDLAGDHQLTRPMADMLTRLDPKALDTAFGPDIAAEIDAGLALPAGTSGQVIRVLTERLGYPADKHLRSVADRSTQELPVVPLPEYSRWQGPSVMSARVIAAHLVRAGLAESQWKNEDYMTKVSALWAPSLRQERIAS